MAGSGASSPPWPPPPAPGGVGLAPEACHLATWQRVDGLSVGVCGAVKAAAEGQNGARGPHFGAVSPLCVPTWGPSRKVGTQQRGHFTGKLAATVPTVPTVPAFEVLCVCARGMHRVCCVLCDGSRGAAAGGASCAAGGGWGSHALRGTESGGGLWGTVTPTLLTAAPCRTCDAALATAPRALAAPPRPSSPLLAGLSRLRGAERR